MIASAVVGALLIGGVLWFARGWVIYQLEVLLSGEHPMTVLFKPKMVLLLLPHPARLLVAGKPRKINRWLAGNFGPVPETADVDLQVEGRLPEALDGAYVRNGPNPQFPPVGGRYHWCAVLPPN